MATEEEKRAERDFLREVVAFNEGIEHPVDLKTKIARMQCNMMDAQIFLECASGRAENGDYKYAAVYAVKAQRAMALGDHREQPRQPPKG